MCMCILQNATLEGKKPSRRFRNATGKKRGNKEPDSKSSDLVFVVLTTSCRHLIFLTSCATKPCRPDLQLFNTVNPLTKPFYDLLGANGIKPRRLYRRAFVAFYRRNNDNTFLTSKSIIQLPDEITSYRSTSKKQSLSICHYFRLRDLHYKLFDDYLRRLDIRIKRRASFFPTPYKYFSARKQKTVDLRSYCYRQPNWNFISRPSNAQPFIPEQTMATLVPSSDSLCNLIRVRINVLYLFAFGVPITRAST